MSSRPTFPSGTDGATVCGILLAAGSGRRFGGDKLLSPLDDGTPIAVMAARNMLAALARVVAVVRPGDERLAQLLRRTGAEVVPCAKAQRGMGHSLACAVNASASVVNASAEVGGWLVGLADMPFIRPDTITAVAKAVASGAAMAAPCYGQKRGHPVAFSARWQAELLSLTGDLGARRLLERQGDRLVMIECDDPAVVWDIDLPGDLVRHQAARQRQP